MAQLSAAMLNGVEISKAKQAKEKS